MSRNNPNYPAIQKIEVFSDHPAGIVVRFTSVENKSIGIVADRGGTFPIERIQRALDELKGPHKDITYRDAGVGSSR